MAIQVAEYQAKLGFDASEFKKGMSDSEKSYSSFADKLASFGGGIGKGLTAAIGAVTTGVTALVGATANGISNLAEYGDNIDKMSQKMGISAEGYQEWDFVMQHCGTSIEGLKASMKTMATAAENGSEAFDKLGISQEQIANMSQEELFNATITALQNVTDETERTYLAGQTLGKGATELGALLNMSAEDTAAMKQQVHELGGVMSDEAVANAAIFQDSLQNLKTAVSGLSRGALAQFLPSVTSVMDGLTMIFGGDSSGIALINQGISGFVTNLSNSIPQILEMGSSIVLTLADAIIQNIPQIMQSGTTIIMELINGIVSLLPSLAEAAVQIIETVCTGIADNLPTLITTVVDVLLQIVQTLLDNLPVLLECVLQIIQGLAQGILDSIPIIVEALPQIITSIIEFLLSSIPQIIQTGIQLLTSLIQALPQIIETILTAVPQIITGLVNAIIGNIPAIVQAGVELLISLIQNLPTIISTILTAIPEIISSLVNAIVGNIPLIVQAGVELLISLVKNLPQIIVEVVKAIPQIIKSLVKAIGEGVPQIVEAGTNLVKGLFNGISNAVGWLYGKLSGWVSSVLSYIKGLFGIHSPSKKTAEFGEFLAEGLAVGIEDNTESALDAAERMSDEVIGTFEDMANDIADIESDALSDANVKKSVTLSTNYSGGSGILTNSEERNVINGISNVFNNFIERAEAMFDKWIDNVNVGALNGVSTTTNKSIVINQGNITVSGCLDKDAAEQVKDIADKQIDDVVSNITPFIPVF